MIKIQIMKFNWVASVVFLAGCMLFSACKPEQLDDCLTNTGPQTTVEREVDAFHSIEMYNNVNLVLSQGNSFQIKVEGGKNILSAIKTNVTDSTLIIHNTMKCNWIRSYKREITVYATVPTLREIRYESSGDLGNTGQLLLDSLYVNIRGGAGKINLDLNTNKLNLSLHYGTTDIHVKGKSMITTIVAGSYGPFYCNDLISNILYISNGGSNECYVHAVHVLEAKIFSQGNIYYTGNPYRIESTIAGSGKLIKLD